MKRPCLGSQRTSGSLSSWCLPLASDKANPFPFVLVFKKAVAPS